MDKQKNMLTKIADFNRQDIEGKTALHFAALYNNLEMVKGLISRNANVSIRDNEGLTALHVAIGFNYLEVADLLIEAGSNLRCKFTSQGWTPLHMLAVFTNNASLVEKVLSRNVEIEARDCQGITALCHALAKGALKIADPIIQAGGDVNSQDNNGNTVLIRMCSKEQRKYITDAVQLAKKLLARGVDVNIKSHVGQTALFSAIKYDELDLVRYFIDSGADVNCQDNEGNSALHYAATSNIEIVEQLLSRNANVNIRNNEGEPALHFALNASKFFIAELLMNAGSYVNFTKTDQGVNALHLFAVFSIDHSLVKRLQFRNLDVHVRDHEGMTALSYALMGGSLKMADVLIKAGGDVNSQDNQGDTALHLIADKSQRKFITDGVELTKALLTRGADVNAKNSQGRTALYLALAYEDMEMAKCLIYAGADLRYQYMDGNSTLHLAALHADVSLVRVCLSRGAKIDVKNKEGNTALHIATMNKKTEVIKELLSRGPDKSIRNNLGNTALETAIIESNGRFLKEHFVAAEENTNFQDATFTRRHLSANRKTPQFNHLKSLGADADVKDFENNNPIHFVEARLVDNLNKKVSKMSLKNRSKARAKDGKRDRLLLYNFESLQDNEIFQLFFRNSIDKLFKK